MDLVALTTIKFNGVIVRPPLDPQSTVPQIVTSTELGQPLINAGLARLASAAPPAPSPSPTPSPSPSPTPSPAPAPAATAFANLTDKTDVNLPQINLPLKGALEGLTAAVGERQPKLPVNNRFDGFLGSDLLWKLLFVTLPAPSGDVTGATDSLAIETAITRAMAGTKWLHVPAGAPYIINREIMFQTGLQVVLDPGAVIQLADSVVQACTVTAGSNSVVVADASALRTGMFVLDMAGNLVAGTPFGDILAGTTITAINLQTNTVTISGNAQGTGARNLRFSLRTNIFRAAPGVNGWSLACPYGMAYLDCRFPTSGYPYIYNADDSTGNGLRGQDNSDWYIDGICVRNPRFHGAIMVGIQTNFRIPRWRGENCGYRTIHFHGDPTNKRQRGHFGLIEDESSGVVSCRVPGDSGNGGVFVCFQGSDATVDTIISTNGRACAVELTGRLDAAAPTVNGFMIGKIIARDTATCVKYQYELQDVAIAQISGKGRYIKIGGCATLAAASANWYLVNSVGAVVTYKVKAIQMPVGSVALHGIREKHRLMMSGGSTGMAFNGVVVAFTEIGTGAGGTDLVWVYNDSLPTTADPYTTAAAAQDVHMWTAEGYGQFFNTSTGKPVRHIRHGSVSLEGYASQAIGSTHLATEYLYQDISYASLTMIANNGGANLASFNGFKVNNFHSEDNGSLFFAGTVSAGGTVHYLRNCANAHLGNITSRQRASTYVSNSTEFGLDVNTRACELDIKGIRVPANGGPAIAVGAPAGAAAAWAGGVAGPIIVRNPRDNVGTPLTVTGGRISRVDATSCIITRSVDVGDAA